MLQITKEEAAFLRKHGVYVTKTCQLKNNGKSRGKYFCVEDFKTMRLLDEFYNDTVTKN